MNIELGGGNQPMKLRKVGMDDYVNVDAYPEPNVDVVCDLVKEEWPFDDSSVDNIFSAEFLEHISYKDIDRILDEAYRVLKTEGTFKFECPDFEGIAKNFTNREKFGITEAHIQYMRRGVIADQNRPFDFHLNILWYDYVRNLLLKHNFKNIQRLDIPYEREDYRSMPFTKEFLNSVKLVMSCQK